MLIKAASSAALYVNQMGQLLFGLSSNVILFIYYFRMNRFEHLSEQISGMFRAMMPVFNNQDTTVITPLLASGNQVCGMCVTNVPLYNVMMFVFNNQDTTVITLLLAFGNQLRRKYVQVYLCIML